MILSFKSLALVFYHLSIQGLRQWNFCVSRLQDNFLGIFAGCIVLRSCISWNMRKLQLHRHFFGIKHVFRTIASNFLGSKMLFRKSLSWYTGKSNFQHVKDCCDYYSIEVMERGRMRGCKVRSGQVSDTRFDFSPIVCNGTRTLSIFYNRILIWK